RNDKAIDRMVASIREFRFAIPIGALNRRSDRRPPAAERCRGGQAGRTAGYPLRRPDRGAGKGLPAHRQPLGDMGCVGPRRAEAGGHRASGRRQSASRWPASEAGRRISTRGYGCVAERRAGWRCRYAKTRKCTLLHFQCRPPSKKGLFFCPKNGVHYRKPAAQTRDGRDKKYMSQSTKDQIEGKFHEVKGEVKEKVGKVANSPNLEAEGQNEKL